ncbi:MAG: hypothetical protein AAFW69_09700 [Pseudomonadota bacterium]
MSAPPLPASGASRPALRLAGEVALVRARVHELTGRARRTLALMLAAEAAGPILWIRPGWEGERLFAPGAARFLAPGRLVFVEAGRAPDLLWSTEEALRSGAAPVVVAEVPTPPALTPIRRLHLAAEASGTAPIGFLLTPGEGGAQGIESRWSLAPVPGGRWQLSRLRARMAPPKSWTLAWTRGRATLDPPLVREVAGAA